MKKLVIIIAASCLVSACIDEFLSSITHYGSPFYNETDIPLYVIFDLDRDLLSDDRVEYCAAFGTCSISSGNKPMWKLIKDSAYVYCIDADKWDGNNPLNITPSTIISRITWTQSQAFHKDTLALPAKIQFKVYYNADYISQIFKDNNL